MKDDEMAIPHLFRCPISLDLFTDPVTLSTGQTYDRSSIEKWLQAGNLTCPVTMQKLHDRSVVPNNTLRHLIHQWLRMEHRFDPEYLKASDPYLSLATMKQNLESKQATLAIKLETLRKIRILSEESASRRSFMVESGFFPLLLHMLIGNPSHGETTLSAEDLELAEVALHCVMNLWPLSELGSLNLFKKSSNLAFLMILLDQGNTQIKISLCNMVEAIAGSSETKELQIMLGQTRSLLQRLVSLLHQNCEASDAGIKALMALCSSELNRENVVKEGGVEGIITYISNPKRRQISMAMANLELLLGLESAQKVLIDNPNSINILVKMIFKVSDHEGSGSAVSSLLILCYRSFQVRQEAINGGIITQLLLLLQSQCSCSAKNKARALLKLLRSMWVRDPSTCNLQYGLVDA